MLVLSIDASLGPVAAAVVDTATGRAVVRLDEGGDTGRAERLPKLVEDLLAEAGATPAQIDRVAVTTGPGGFTGVRVGVAFARGFALVHSTPVVGIDTLTALAISAAAGPDAPRTATLAFVQGRKGRAHMRRFGADGLPAGPVEEVDAADLSALAGDDRIAGPGADVLAPGRAAATGVSVEALARHAAGLDPADYPPEPRYAAPPDAKPAAPSRLFGGAVPPRPEMPSRPRPRDDASVAEQ